MNKCFIEFRKDIIYVFGGDGISLIENPLEAFIDFLYMGEEELSAVFDISIDSRQALQYYSKNFISAPTFPIILWGIYKIKEGRKLRESEKLKMSEDLKQSQNFFLEQAEIILNEIPTEGYKDYTSLTPMQRYADHVCNTFDTEAKISFHDITISNKPMIDAETMEVYERYYPESILEACFILFMNMVINNYTIKKCGHCGKFFVKKPGYNNEYCNRPIPGKNKTCKDIGAIARYKKDDIQLTFERHYKKVSAYCKRKGLEEAYEDWLKLALALKTNIRKDKMSEEKFEALLNRIEKSIVYGEEPPIGLQDEYLSNVIVEYKIEFSEKAKKKV